MTRGTIADVFTSRPMSLAEWVELSDDEPGELVDGRFVEEETPDVPHEVVVSWLRTALAVWLEARKGIVLGSAAKYAVTPARGRKPDLSVFFTGDRRVPRGGPVAEPPDILIEVVSPLPADERRDRVHKLHDYAAFRVRWYWIVDPTLRTFAVLRLADDGHYAYAAAATKGIVEIPGCEGLTLDLDALWARIEDVVGDDR